MQRPQYKGVPFSIETWGVSVRILDEPAHSLHKVRCIGYTG